MTWEVGPQRHPVLALGVLFLVIGIFNGNLKDMVANSGFNNLTKTKDTTAQYSQTENSYANSQVNVRITGSQGLTIEQLSQLAQSNITTLAKNSALTPQQEMDMAKWLTIYGISTGPTMSAGARASSYYKATAPELFSKYPIAFNMTKHFTTVSGTNVDWTTTEISDRTEIVNDINNGSYFTAQ